MILKILRLIFEVLLRILLPCNYILINALDHPCQFDDIPWVFGIANPFEELEVVATLVPILYHPLIRHHAVLSSAEPEIFPVLTVVQSKEVVVFLADARGEMTGFQQSLGKNDQTI